MTVAQFSFRSCVNPILLSSEMAISTAYGELEMLAAKIQRAQPHLKGYIVLLFLYGRVLNGAWVRCKMCSKG